ncbi:MAG: MFS transporter [Candidatus Heimdallarchaeota archaeon]|nr:MFS transporter [Candidatus Heimdallarchaeota archaeon]MDH5644955.1 MFS transporter [Candidatus Heimdallarchaeota archaeon]
MSQEEYKKPLILLLLAVFVDLVGFGILIPILPFFLVFLGGDELTLSWLLAIYSLAQFIAAPLWGKLSDKIGRRPVILVGLIGSSVSFTVFGLAQSMFLLFFARFLAGIFTGASLPTARAYIADIVPKERRAVTYGMMGAAFGLGFTLGPVIGSVLSSLTIGDLSSYAIPSFGAAILTFLNFIGAVIWLPEPSIARNGGIESRKSLIDTLKTVVQYDYVGLLISTYAMIILIFSGFEAMFPLFSNAADPTIDETSMGYVFGVIGVVIVIVQGGVIKPAVAKYGEIVVIKVGIVFLIVGFFVFPFTNSIATIILAAVPLAIGAGLTNPALTSEISKRVPSEIQGSAMGLNSGISALMRVLGMLIAGFMYKINYVLHFRFGIILLCITLLIMSIRVK